MPKTNHTPINHQPKYKKINKFLWATFPISVWLSNFIYGRRFYDFFENSVNARMMSYPNMNTDEYFAKKIQQWTDKYPKLKKWNFTILDKKHFDYEVPGFDGVQLSVRVYRTKNSDKWVIISHGWTENKFEVLHIADMYLKDNFNVIVYDARAHGESSKGHFISTISYLEKFDLVELIRWAHSDKNIQANKIVLHGQSMGAATSIEAVKILDASDSKFIRAVIVDGCFDNLEKQLLHVAQTRIRVNPIFYKQGIKSWIYNKLDYELRDSAPANFLNYIPKIPFLIIHGRRDTFVPPINSENIYQEKIKFEKVKISELLIMPNSIHVESFQSNPEMFQKRIQTFLSDKMNDETK